MHTLIPLPVAIPLLGAALLTAFGPFLGRRVDDLVALTAALASLVISLLLVVGTRDHDLVYWFGGWHPRRGLALGVSFTVEPGGAAIATLACALTVAALLFAWRYFDETGKLFAVLVLVFLAGMTGFALSGDLFNMFVWFELMSVAAYALTGYRSDAASPIQGAINFAVTNSVGSFCVLFGIGLLYARTGALNLDQIGEAVARRPADGLVIVAFTLLLVGFLTKAGAVPFHFWLADAYSVAPLPVCVLLAGVMSELGPHAIGRIYWSAFSGTITGTDIRPILVGLGIATALVGGTMCFLQRDLKRLLAFATISNIGVVLMATALVTKKGLAAGAVYVNTNGLLRGALFIAVGVLVRQLKSGDELELRGAAGRLKLTGAVVVAAGLAFALVPPFGPFLANALLVDSAGQLGYGWLPPLVTLATALSAGAVLRMAARIWGGLGARDDPLLSHEPSAQLEEPEDAAIGPAWPSTTIAAILVGCALALGLVPGLAAHALEHAGRAIDRTGHAREVLHGIRPPRAKIPSYSPSATAYAYGAAATIAALAVAATGLYRPRLARRGSRVRGPLATLRALHNGVVGDYVTWLVVGAAVLGGAFTLALR